MKEHFLDYEHSKMLKELDFSLMCYGFYAIHNREPLLLEGFKARNTKDGHAVHAPTYEQAEQWLWDKYRAHVVISGNRSGGFGFGSKSFDAPVIARREAIKEAIGQMYKDSKE